MTIDVRNPVPINDPFEDWWGAVSVYPRPNLPFAEGTLPGPCKALAKEAWDACFTNMKSIVLDAKFVRRVIQGLLAKAKLTPAEISRLASPGVTEAYAATAGPDPAGRVKVYCQCPHEDCGDIFENHAPADQATCCPSCGRQQMPHFVKVTKVVHAGGKTGNVLGSGAEGGAHDL